MLLRLIPDTSFPTVLFTLTFTNLPDVVPFPQNWQLQLQQLLQEELEMPDCIHALDKSVWATCLLHEVSFNIVSKTISCRFVDETCLDWSIADDRCIQILQSVLADVNESSCDIEREKARQPVPPTPPSRPSSPMKVTKHKKSRSILMSLVASLVPSSQPSSPTQSEQPEVQSSFPSSPGGISRSARALRRKARATLVDVYRRYVLPELSAPFCHGGYIFFILQSMLRRIESQMCFIVQNAGAELGRVGHAPRLRISPSALSENPFEDDEGSSATTETDTDGSSIHTPQDSFAEHPIMCHTTSSEDALINAENGVAVPRSPISSPVAPSPPSYSRAAQRKPDPLAEYTMLHASAVRLRGLLCRTEETERNVTTERTTQMAMLEIKSRRRAWSARALLGSAPMVLAGLATPVRSSPLVWCEPVTPELLASKARLTVTPRSIATRLGAMRLSTINEGDSEGGVPEDVESESAEGFELQDSSYNVQMRVPFPGTSDDFCSTGPQDPLPLFAHPPEYSTSDYTRPSFSGDVYEMYPMAYSDASMDDPPVVPIHVYGDGFDPSTGPGCEEFTLALDFKPRRHSSSTARMNRQLVNYRQ